MQNNDTRSPEWCAQEQLDAYNARDIDRFAAVYSENVELIDLVSGDVFCSGKEALRKRYGQMFSEKTELSCSLVSRVVCGNVVYDEELVSGLVHNTVVHAVATYLVADGHISKAWFVREQA